MSASGRRFRLMELESELAGDLIKGIDLDLLDLALTHRSYAYEHGGTPHNERLEFLGDAVLGIVITDTLYRKFPDHPEGHLAKMRAAVVNARALAGVAQHLGLGEYLLLGRGEETTGGREKSSILSDVMEAVIGAIYLGCGVGAASELIHRYFDPLIGVAADLGAGLDWKTSLQEIAARANLGLPEYLITSSGPDHEKEFHARVRLGDEVISEGWGRSKKIAEKQAAQSAYHQVTAREL